MDNDLEKRLDYITAMLEVLISNAGLWTRCQNYMENPEDGCRQDEMTLDDESE